MNESEIRKNIIQSMAEPEAPENLKLATIERGKAIEIGRMAEKKLEQLKDAAPSPSVKALAAKSIIGRVAQTRKMSQGVTAELMTKELLKSERFRQVTNLPADKLLSGIRTGALLKAMANTKVAHSPEAPEKGFGGPTL